jgi:glycosyltransferase involved in cell wall biosynthesis
MGDTTELSDSPAKNLGARVIAGIPAYNEAECIGEVIQKALRHVDEVIVADDGSVDDTARIAETAGATVVRSNLNQGAGNATRLCFQVARDKNADALITIDADGQHNAEEIPSVVAPLFNKGADLVIGSRFIEYVGDIPRYRRFGIGIITLLLNFAAKVKISDSQSCFRAYSKRAIKNLDITENGFGFSIETLVQARRKGLVIKEVPISCVYNAHSHSLNPLVHGLRVALSVIRLRLKYRLNGFINEPGY